MVSERAQAGTKRARAGVSEAALERIFTKILPPAEVRGSSTNIALPAVDPAEVALTKLEAASKFNEAMLLLFTELESASGRKKEFIEKRIDSMQNAYYRDFA